MRRIQFSPVGSAIHLVSSAMSLACLCILTHETCSTLRSQLWVVPGVRRLPEGLPAPRGEERAPYDQVPRSPPLLPAVALALALLLAPPLLLVVALASYRLG